jgi:hypothetical protein
MAALSLQATQQTTRSPGAADPVCVSSKAPQLYSVPPKK